MSSDRPTSAELTQLSLEQREAFFEAAHEGLRLTPDEARRRDVAREFAPAEVWGATASSCVYLILESYRRGEVDLQEALAAMQRISVGAVLQTRVTLLGLIAACVLQVEPRAKRQGQRRPDWPLWLKRATAELVLVEHARTPDERRSPQPYHGKISSPVIDRALSFLVRMGWFESMRVPTPRTVDGWVRARLKEAEGKPNSP